MICSVKAASLLDPIIAALPKITVEQSVEGLLARVDEATREKTGGTFLGYEGDTIPW